MREDLQRLIKTVGGRTVFILGGGPSVTPLILDTLNKSASKVVCLNSAVKFIDNPLAVMWCDNSWASNNLAVLDRLTCPKFYTKSHAAAQITSNKRSISNSTILHKTGEFGFDMDINNVRGNNSGAHCINLLSNCNARTIALIGFDMHAPNNVAHFHNEYTYAVRPSVYSELFIPSIESMVDIIKQHKPNVHIYNCNENSALKCFPYKHMDDLI